MFKVSNEIFTSFPKKKVEKENVNKIAKLVNKDANKKVEVNLIDDDANFEKNRDINDKLSSTGNSIRGILADVHNEIKPLINYEFIDWFKFIGDKLQITFTNKCVLEIYPMNNSHRYRYMNKKQVLFDETVINENRKTQGKSFPTTN